MTDRLRNSFPLICLFLFSQLLVLHVSGCEDQQKNRVNTVFVPVNGYNFQPPAPPQNTVSTATVPTISMPDNRNQTIEALLNSLDITREFSFLSTLAADSYQGRKTGSAGAEASADFISTEFTRLGLQPWTRIGLSSYTHHFIAGDTESDNVIAVLPGRNPDNAYVILAAHYDHLGLDVSGQPFNGADDNAAGVAAILEIASIFQQTGLKPEKDIVFCAFSGEETGQRGSKALGRTIFDMGLGNQVEMINIDGIGATGGGYLGIWDEGFSGAAKLVGALEEAGTTLGTPTKREGTDIGSDAQPFDWQYSIPAVTVDWDWGSDPSIWHPYYHTIYDDAGQINQTVLEQATRVVLLGLWLRASET